MEIPDREVSEHRIELPGARRAHRQRLLYQPYAVRGKFRELVSREGLLPRKRNDRRLDLRLFAREGVL